MTRLLSSIAAAIVCSSVALLTGQTPAVQQPAAGRGPALPPVVIGPPAPAPAEVAIPRPSTAEVADVNAAVKKLVDSDKSSSKALLKKYESLLMLQPPRLNVAATYTQTTQRMGPRHEGFVDIAKRGNIDLLLHGDSITDWWVQGDANKAMFEKYFGGYRTANFAIAGDTTQGVLWGLKNGEGQGFMPKAVMVMIGTNNTGATNNTGRSPRPRLPKASAPSCSSCARIFPTRRSCCSLSFRAAFRATPYATRLRTSIASSPGSTTGSMSSTWTSARSFSTSAETSCPTPSAPTTCTRRQRAMTSGARP